jgi:hypothetical protein
LYRDNEKFVDERMLAVCKLLNRFHTCIQKKDLKNQDMPDLIRQLVEGKEFYKTMDIRYYHKIFNLFSATFFNFTQERMRVFLRLFEVSEEKEWVRYMLRVCQDTEC